ncbi:MULTISPECIES: response regulator transcription factor [Psychromonas]|uniref:Response regulator transcription factor n=1 Tax=Psychromonas arctica TaxID=168275 RepID=A0ABU9H959_9GAMM|nr:response regulator transcription factor [Psychromonas sp. SP041]
MDNTKQILVVDDDKSIRELLSEYLAKAGFSIISAEDGIEMTLKLKDNQPDLIILDVMMPGDDGFTLCQRIRQTSNVPIIMLTANSDEVDRVLGLEIGADDYIAKPFSPRELLARIKALLRRSSFLKDESKSTQLRYIKFAQWKLDTLQHNLVSDLGETLTLTGADYQLLMLFLNRPYKAISRDEICQALHGRDAFANERGIDVHLSRLRQSLGDNAKLPQIIKTVRGAGYTFIAEVQHLAQ